jgi:hypothetical protein
MLVKAQPHFVLAHLQEVVESRILPIVRALTLLRRSVFDDGLFNFAVPAPGERPALIDRVKRIDECACALKLYTRSEASRTEPIYQVHLGGARKALDVEPRFYIGDIGFIHYSAHIAHQARSPQVLDEDKPLWTEAVFSVLSMVEFGCKDTT